MSMGFPFQNFPSSCTEQKFVYNVTMEKTAEKEYKEAIKINPGYAEAHNNLGSLFDDLKRYDETEKEYKGLFFNTY